MIFVEDASPQHPDSNDGENFPNRSDSGSTQEKKSPLSPKAKALLLIALFAVPAVATIWYFEWGPAAGPKPITFMVPMRDGVKLATDVYLPAGQGPFPVVLYRTPYGKDSDTGPIQYVQYNIAIVTQDFRGCHDSGGVYDAWGTDAQDALDTVNWMKTQPWFNGVYGTYGGSARGITQYMQVQAQPNIACQMIMVGTPDLYSIALFQGGAPHMMLAQDWLNGIGHGDFYPTVFDHPLSNDAFAAARRIDDNEWQYVTWPALHIGGWYDCFSQGTLNGFMGYQYKGGQGGAGQSRLIMGPWTHDLFNVENRSTGQLTYPNSTDQSYYIGIMEKMFAEKLLKTMQYGDFRTAANVTYYVMGDINATSDDWNRWATANDWPVPYSNQTWYFHTDGVLNQTAPSSNSNQSYVFDPKNPVQTLGGQNLNNDNRGPFDQRPVENGRSDILHFDTSISTPLLITGRMWVHLFIASNCTDTDFTVKLSDEYPGGAVMNIADGIIRIRSRLGQDQAVLMDGSGANVYEAWVDLWSTSYVFNAGHTMRISVSSSNYPRFDVNPNTGAEIRPVNASTPTVCAYNTLVMSPTNASAILLPVPSSSPTFM